MSHPQEPTERVRAVAYEMISDLRATPAGFSIGTWPSLEHASKATIHRALAHLQHVGMPVVYSGRTQRWTLRGEPRQMPAFALSRMDLLDELTDTLRQVHGVEGVDPLVALRDLAIVRWGVVVPWPLSMARRAHGVVWRLDYHRHKLTLEAAPLVDGAADVSRWVRVAQFTGMDITDEAAKRFGDYLIEVNHEATLQRIADAAEPEKQAAAW